LKAEALAGQYARAYWVTRYLDDTQSAFLRGLLKKRSNPRALEAEVARTLGVPRRDLWSSVDHIVSDHFAPSIPACDCDACNSREELGRCDRHPAQTRVR
jgi:hypothetical protein